ncbi:uncharacterized protein LOC144107943 [Amblyomma americanum]
MLAANLGKVAATFIMLQNIVIEQAFCIDDVDDELVCNAQNAITCYWNIADKFGKSHFTAVPANRKDYLTSFCQVSDNSVEFPEDATCKDFYAGCTDFEKRQFARMEAGYAELQKDATATEVCQPVESLRECINLDVMRNCYLPPVSGVGTSFARVTSRRRVAEKLKTCLQNSLHSCDSKTYGTAMGHLKRIADSIVDLNSPSMLGVGLGSGSKEAGATVGLVWVAVVGWFLSALC